MSTQRGEHKGRRGAGSREARTWRSEEEGRETALGAPDACQAVVVGDGQPQREALGKDGATEQGGRKGQGGERVEDQWGGLLGRTAGEDHTCGPITKCAEQLIIWLFRPLSERPVSSSLA